MLEGGREPPLDPVGDPKNNSHFVAFRNLHERRLRHSHILSLVNLNV